MAVRGARRIRPGPRCPLVVDRQHQRHAIDVQLYLRSVLAHLPGLPQEELQNYLPDVWKRDQMAEQRAALNAHHAALINARVARPSA